MPNNRIASDSPRHLFDSDDANRVVGLKQPNGTEEFFAMSTQQPPAAQGAMQSYIASSAVPVSVTNSTSETALATITIPANAMGPNGWVEIEATYSYTNSANNKTLRIRFGGTPVASSVTSTTAAITVVARVQNRNDVNSQVAAPANMGFTATANVPLTAAINTTAAVAVTIQATMAALAETVTLERWSLRVFKQG